MDVVRISVSALLVQDDEPPMHLPAVASLVAGERVDERPIDVEPVDGTPFFRIRNGRHRFFGAVAKAEPDVPCIVRPRPATDGRTA